MKKHVFSVLVSLSCTSAVFIFHVLGICKSMLNPHVSKSLFGKELIASNYLKEDVTYHKVLPAFQRRPVTTYFIENLSAHSSLNIGESFVVVNFFFLFLCGIVLFQLSYLIQKKSKLAYVNQVLFFFSFTILFAFFPTIYSYDEPIQYFLIMISLVALIKRKWALFIIVFSLSSVVRETSLFLIPAFAIFLGPKGTFSKGNKLKKGGDTLLIFGLPVIFYLLYVFLFFPDTLVNNQNVNLLDRFECFQYNFQNQKFAIETIVSVFLAVGIHLYVLLSYLIKYDPPAIERKMIKCFIFTLILNTIIVFLFARARETRLFALPLVFLWPIFGRQFLAEIKILRRLINHAAITLNWLYLSLIFAISILSGLICYYIYQPTGMYKIDSLQDEYLLMAVIFITLHFSLRHFQIVDKSRGVSKI